MKAIKIITGVVIVSIAALIGLNMYACKSIDEALKFEEGLF